MTEAETAVERGRMGEGAAALAPIRLAVGLAQGLALYALFRADELKVWPADVPTLYGPLLLTTLFLPVVVLGGLGRLRLTTLLIWTVVAGALLMGLGWHDVARQATERLGSPYLSPTALPFLAVALFILHHLIVPADQERRVVASFPRYFDVAWKAGVQLALSIAFTGALWALLALGAALFNLIGIDEFGTLLTKEWFNMPVTTVTFALAVHLTDVKDGLIRGVRSVALMLLSWLLPVIAGLTGAFLLALPFTGLDGLWEQGSATGLMLTAAAALIVLINAAYQDGTEAARPPAVLRWAAMLGGVLLVPLIGVATWGLSLRIGQHGLTPDRIVAAACVVVGAIHAVGYAWAALSSVRARAWMQPLERTNLVGAVTAAGLILLLFSPVLDPACLSVMDQTARLARGAVTPAKFDYAFLRFDSGKVGEAALAKLAASSDAEVARRAKQAQAIEDRWDIPRDRVDRKDRSRLPVIAMWPQGSSAPDGFVIRVLPGDPRWSCQGDRCLVEVRDLNGDGVPEVLLATSWTLHMFSQDADGRFVSQGQWDFSACEGEIRQDPRALMRQGRLTPQPSPWPDLATGGAPKAFSRETCPGRRIAYLAPPVIVPGPPAKAEPR